jgi:type I protein arginine methyltransferase
LSGVEAWDSQAGLHHAYLTDHVRNKAFHDAIVRNVKPGSRVLDLGTGTGIWACVAARAGAAKVVAVEFSNLVEEARRTVQRNGLEHIVEVVHSDIRHVRLEREFDVVIHELIGGRVWEEDMIELTAIAHDAFLRPGGVLFPREVRVAMCPWYARSDRPLRTDWSSVYDIDVSHLYEAELVQWHAERSVGCVHGRLPDNILAEPRWVYTARLGIDREPIPAEVRFEFVAERNAVATGILAFMAIDLGDDIVIDTGPYHHPTNWGQLYIPAPEVLELEAGRTYQVRVVPQMSLRGWGVEWSLSGSSSPSVASR